jgi:hypothetical protein
MALNLKLSLSTLVILWTGIGFSLDEIPKGCQAGEINPSLSVYRSSTTKSGNYNKPIKPFEETYYLENKPFLVSTHMKEIIFSKGSKDEINARVVLTKEGQELLRSHTASVQPSYVAIMMGNILVGHIRIGGGGLWEGNRLPIVKDSKNADAFSILCQKMH